jgi:hypothetical protein
MCRFVFLLALHSSCSYSTVQEERKSCYDKGSSSHGPTFTTNDQEEPCSKTDKAMVDAIGNCPATETLPNIQNKKTLEQPLGLQKPTSKIITCLWASLHAPRKRSEMAPC